METFLLILLAFVVNLGIAAPSFALFSEIVGKGKLAKTLFLISLVPPLGFALIILDLILIGIEAVLENWN